MRGGAVTPAMPLPALQADAIGGFIKIDRAKLGESRIIEERDL